jgi:hypothetical protein
MKGVENGLDPFAVAAAAVGFIYDETLSPKHLGLL